MYSSSALVNVLSYIDMLNHRGKSSTSSNSITSLGTSSSGIKQKAIERKSKDIAITEMISRSQHNGQHNGNHRNHLLMIAAQRDALQAFYQQEMMAAAAAAAAAAIQAQATSNQKDLLNGGSNKPLLPIPFGSSGGNKESNKYLKSKEYEKDIKFKRSRSSSPKVDKQSTGHHSPETLRTEQSSNKRSNTPSPRLEALPYRNESSPVITCSPPSTPSSVASIDAPTTSSPNSDKEFSGSGKGEHRETSPTDNKSDSRQSGNKSSNASISNVRPIGFSVLDILQLPSKATFGDLSPKTSKLNKDTKPSFSISEQSEQSDNLVQSTITNSSSSTNQNSTSIKGEPSTPTGPFNTNSPVATSSSTSSSNFYNSGSAYSAAYTRWMNGATNAVANGETNPFFGPSPFVGSYSSSLGMYCLF